MEVLSLLSCFSLFLLLTTAATTSAAEITPPSTLYASNPNQNWSSPTSAFSLSFIPTTTTTFAASITYSGIPIWTAGGSSATSLPSSASLQFLTDGNLRLLSGNSTLIWQSNTANSGVTAAELTDSGNLILKNATNTIWSSFENPTDTILPSQIFTTNNVLTSGFYSFKFLKSGNLTLTWGNDNTTINYWSLGLNSSFSSNTTLISPNLLLQQIGILSINDSSLSRTIDMAFSSDYGEGSDILRFVKLDSDGNLKIYSSARGTGVSNMRWAAISDQCEVFGYCGNMGICSYNDTNPVCGCPSQNFDPIDPNDRRKGCKRKVEIVDCPTSPIMMQLDHTFFLTYPPEISNEVFFMGIASCGANCLSSSPCVASTSLSDGTGLCYSKIGNFVSGYQSAALPSTSYVKICGPSEPNPPDSSSQIGGGRKQWKLPVWVVVIVVLGTFLGLVLLEGSFWWFCCKNNPKFGGLSSQYALLEYASGAPVQFSYKELQRSTKGFREKLGAGGFGAVYRGFLANRTVVAVKQLEGIEQGEKQFRMEVATISSTHHLNLVRLIGFCSEGRHRLLVYEFMKNGSLDNFLFSPEEKLDWENRFNIALGTARGITYLHEECRDCIVHCDIKPENILLDENYNSKVSDFGLAKLINPKDHRYRTLTSVRGTRGYLAPEWLANLPITSKSDVYSFGMVLLEIVSGKRNFEVSKETNGKKFSIWAFEEYEKGNVEGILDKKLGVDEVDMEEVSRAVQVSFWCIQEQPTQRPMMGKVVQMLEGITEIGKPPAPKIATEGSVSGTSINVSSSISAFSTMAASAPAPSSSSSFQKGGISSFVGGSVERVSSSLLGSEPN